MLELAQRRTSVRVDDILSRRPAVGLAVGVVRHGTLESFCGRGLADIPSQEPVTEDTVFRIASISKTLTAVAVLQLWEQALLDLDRPADDFLRAFRLVPARPGWRPATVRHLLTHTAGVPQSVHPTRMLGSGWFGESVAPEERVPTLAEYYGGSLRLAAEPGTVCTYTDHGFAVLGQVVEDVSGLPLDRYLHEHVFEPLGMVDTHLPPSPGPRTRRATGYRIGAMGAVPVNDRVWVTAAASSVCSTPRDMARYVAALLGGGTGEHGPVLKPETLAMMFAPQYQPDPRVPGLGLAFFRGDLGGHAVVEHQGVLPGFDAQICLAPEDGVGVVAFTNGARNAAAWLPAETTRLLGDLLGAPADSVRADVPPHAELWRDLCGWYRPRAQRTDLQALSLLGAGVQVRVRHGRLAVRTLSPLPALRRGLPLHPDDPDAPDVFRVDLSEYGIGAPRVVFSRDRAGVVTGIHLDGLPMSADRRPVPGRGRRG